MYSLMMSAFQVHNSGSTPADVMLLFTWAVCGYVQTNTLLILSAERDQIFDDLTFDPFIL